MAAKKKRPAARKPTRKAAKPAAKKIVKKAARKAAPKAPAPYPVVAYLTVGNAADAIAFYKRAFAAKEDARMPADDGKRIMHAALAINGGTLMLADAFPEYGAHSGAPPQPGAAPTVSIMLNVDDVDAWFDRAIAAGALSVMKPENMFWGGRFCSLSDPSGHRWSIHGPQKK